MGNTKPLACNTVVEDDVGVSMRDGVRFYADTYRLVDAANSRMPAILY